MRRFTVTTEGSNRLGLRNLCEDFINDTWVPAHLTPEQAAQFVLDHFKRSVLAEIKLLDVAVAHETPAREQT